MLVRFVVVVLLLVWGVGCAFVPVFEPFAPREIERGMAPRAFEPVRRVVVISIDGFAPRLMKYVPTPALDRLAAEGASAAEAVTIAPPITLPSHASMLSGVVPSVHGVTWNVYRPWGDVSSPTIFNRCEDEGLRCDLFASKRKFANLADGVRHYRYTPRASDVLAAGLASLRSDDPDLVVLHLSELDTAGHTDGWGSRAQLEALVEIDAEIGSFVEEASRSGDRPIAILVTADHGGLHRTHHADLRQNRRIPWILWGDGVDAGAAPQWVSTLDTAATVAWLLGLEAPPIWVGSPRAVGGAN